VTARVSVGRAAAGIALLAALGAGILYGFVARERRWFPNGLVKAAVRLVRPEPTPVSGPHRGVVRSTGADRLAQREKIRALQQLPYLQGYNPASGNTGVLVYDEARADPGWNLAVSAHAAQAQLLDMRGLARHRWGLDLRKAWPDLRLDGDKVSYGQYWRRAELLPDGDLLAIWEYIGLVRVDKRSHLKWAAANGAHHDLAVASDGTIFVLTREAHVLPAINPTENVFEDFISVLASDGRPLKRISLLAAFAGSDYAAALARMGNAGDILHANAVSLLDGRLSDRSPAFRAGNLLVSLRSLNVVAVLDPQSEKIVWALSGAWRAQHSPRILENGRMLLFDNFASMQAGASRVLELDPFTQVIAWRYGEREGEGIFTESNGEVERLGNGNTLVVESDAGRAIEVTPGGETVWEYVNPFRVGEKQELRATLKQLTRLPAGLSIAWADHPEGRPSADPKIRR
jgi:hypothetical protein